ncbi:hypothetical protein AC578_4732 [Pseudocercospora eumusae]|uniref:Uncharacterized protein n=1 Tax=Pseudocercospora eumusae TaxID=321146 RepID=A0A139GUA6_9PEZI|nr:hypothetical protein AC578_4732 [Pseudocercospora eumusae]KXS93765.1 hypothetical protein AC578_4732 [Pseudocercospora eumusae]KXS93767.1 hypothetical protein AC578_4732 [Pseudocercospora eumusae]
MDAGERSTLQENGGIGDDAKCTTSPLRGDAEQTFDGRLVVLAEIEDFLDEDLVPDRQRIKPEIDGMGVSADEGAGIEVLGEGFCDQSATGLVACSAC